jgi:MoaA/NifB/PqqE/SkfB family radical SAM enzyme
MTVIFAYPKPLVEQHQGDVVTVVVPAPNGCDLKCPFCIIGQRGERESWPISLRPGDYTALIGEWVRTRQVACIAIQGDEPLLPEAIEYTFAILETAKVHGIPSSIVTNGTNLKQQVAQLRALSLDFLCVSLDATAAETHDRLRGVQGAFARTVTGLRAAAPLFGNQVLVSSVLLPRKVEYLIGMPRFLADLGIRRWCINPMIRIPGDGTGGPVMAGEELALALRRLHDEARRYSVDAIVCDDLDGLSELRRSNQILRDVPFKVLGRDRHLFRLLPSGECGYGSGILRKAGGKAPVWQPEHQSPAEFLSLVLGTHVN